MKKSSIWFFLTSMVLFFATFAAFADTSTATAVLPVVPPVAPDLGASLLALWQAIQNHAGTALILVPVFQILKSNPVMGLLGGLGGKGMQIAVALITTGGFVINAWATGQSLGMAAVTGLFTAGGCMLIYDAFAGINPPTTPSA